jgi:hypothetical protein
MANDIKSLDDSQRVRMDKRPKPMDTGMKAYDANDRKLLDRIYQNINRYFRFNENNINRFRNDRYFLFYDQWSQDERQAFKDLNKPIFTYNKIYDYYRKLIGEQRFNTSNIEVRSISGMVHQKDVTMRADIIRGIEYKSRADIAYQTAFASAVSGGLGCVRLRTDYLNPKTMEQDIFIEPVKFAERVFWDPLAKSATKTDGNFMGVYDQMDRDDFIEKYPEIPYPVSFPVNYNTRYFNWGDKKSITICEYYEKKWYNFTLYQLDNGECISKKEYNRRKKEFDEGQLQAAMPEQKAPEQPNTGIEGGQEQMSPAESMIHEEQPPSTPTPIPQIMGTEQQQPPQVEKMAAGMPTFPKVVASRKSRDYKIICYKAIFGHILEQYEWPSKEFPFAVVLGDEVILDGEHIIVSITRYAKDPQRFLNFLASDLAQAAKNNRREQFLVTADNIAGYEMFWKNPANQAGALPYNPDSVTKQPPVRLPPPELPQTLVQNLQQADRDLRSIMGYPQENEPRMFGNLSGKAIREMQRDGNSTNLVFFDNLKRAQEQVGRTILAMLPRIYDTERTITTQGMDGKTKQITVNKKVAGGIINDLSKGEFDISVTGGANFAVQKEEALRVIMELVSANPQVFPVVADIIAKNVDIEDNIELVNRLKTLVPPEVLAKADGKPLPPQPPNPQQQQMMQMQQMQQKLETAKVQLAQQKIQTEEAKTMVQHELNQIKMQQAIIDHQKSQLSAVAEIQKANVDYKATQIESAAKIASAHSNIADKHFQHLTEIHGLQQVPLEKATKEQANQSQKNT